MVLAVFVCGVLVRSKQAWVVADSVIRIVN